MEHIVVSQIAKHLDRHRILDPNQHGFRKGLSCETRLIQFVQELHTNTAQGKQVDAIVMDFSKAFDKVAHNRLLYKLGKYGIEGKTKNWIKDFLTNRSQQVVQDGMASSNVPVTSGVPQGSVLSPILFLIFINDISDGITSNIRLFADDTIIYRNIKNTEDAEKLQTDLHTLERWSREWQMEFHPSKCNTLHITRSRSPILRDYMLYNTTLEAVDSAKYLGVTLATDLRFNRHIDNIRKNASGTLQFLKRNLRISSSEVKTQAYQSYVRPRLEYAATVWDPFTKTNRDKLEMVQRYSARWTLGRYHNRSSVTDMLNYLGWRRLEMRRVDARMSIGSASLARSIRIRFHFRHRTGRIRSVSDHRAGRVWRSRHRSKTPNCLPGARDQVPALFRNAIERRGASVDSNSGAPITQSTFNMLRRMANLLSLLNWWLHRYDNEDDYALFQV